MRRDRFAFLGIGVAAGALMVLAGLTAADEAGPFLARQAASAERVAMFSATPAEVPLLTSSDARNALLDTCLTTLSQIARRSGTPPDVVRTVGSGCLSTAEAIAAREPLSANTWYIAATLAARKNDLGRVGDYLEMSYRTGPAEQWVAERRALFAYPMRTRLPPDLAAKVDADFVLLLRTNSGVEALAARYVDDPGFREHLTDIAVTLDNETQARFLDRVKAALKRAGD